MDLNTIFADPRRRNLAILAAAALLSLVLAVAAVWQQSGAAGHYTPTQFFPGFAKVKNTAAHIHIASKAGTFDLVFKPEKDGWVVPQRGDYRASSQLVKNMLTAFGALMALEPKTAQPQLLDLVGLGAPPRGDGIAITVSDDKGREMAALIVGKGVDIADPSGGIGLFVRRPDENQSWLARTVFEPRGSLSDWLDKRVMDVDRSRIQEVDVDPAGGTPYVVARAAKSDPDFKLTPLPAGKSVADPSVPDGVAAAIVEFGFDDVRRAYELDFANTATTARSVVKTFDGLKITVNVQKSGADYWATVSAEATVPGNAIIAKEASMINANAAGWAYKLPGFKGQLFMTTLDDLLKAPAPTGLPPGLVPPQ